MGLVIKLETITILKINKEFYVQNETDLISSTKVNDVSISNSFSSFPTIFIQARLSVKYDQRFCGLTSMPFKNDCVVAMGED